MAVHAPSAYCNFSWLKKLLIKEDEAYVIVHNRRRRRHCQHHRTILFQTNKVANLHSVQLLLHLCLLFDIIEYRVSCP